MTSYTHANVSTLPLVRNPLVWLRRFRYRRGYGVHSPYAFGLITGVIYETTPYYAYARLLRLHPWWQRLPLFRTVARCRMLFRLANFSEAQTIAVVGSRPVEKEYLLAARTSASFIGCEEAASAGAGFVLVAADALPEFLAVAARLLSAMPKDGLVVVEGIHLNAEALATWRMLLADACIAVSFDLYDYGILTFDRRLMRQDYVVNF